MIKLNVMSRVKVQFVSRLDLAINCSKLRQFDHSGLNSIRFSSRTETHFRGSETQYCSQASSQGRS